VISRAADMDSTMPGYAILDDDGGYSDDNRGGVASTIVTVRRYYLV